MTGKAIGIGDDYTPPLVLSDKQLPDLKKWRPGGRYRLVVDVEQTGLNNHEDGKDKQSTGTFRVLSVTPVQTTAGKDVILKALAKKANA